MQKLIDKDNRSIFSFLSHTLPLCYRQLCDLPPLSVLEWVIERETGTGDIVEDAYYLWGIDLGFKILGFDIPRFEPDNPIRRKYQRPEIDALPPAIQSIYSQFDGMGLSGGFGLKSFDFPWKIDQWQALMDYYEDVGLKTGDAFLPFQGKSQSDPRVIARLRSADFLVVDCANREGSIFVIRYDAPKVAESVSICQLDTYFSSALGTIDPQLSL